MHIPTLVSLRAFEAVARHKSFRKAADEICVTHAAVSHQIKALETLIGIQLFDRTSRSVELTTAGEQYYPSIREHIQGIIKATKRIQAPNEPDVLLVQSYASFNTMWLQPRLAEFLQDNPNTRVRIISNGLKMVTMICIALMLVCSMRHPLMIGFIIVLYLKPISIQFVLQIF